MAGLQGSKPHILGRTYQWQTQKTSSVPHCKKGSQTAPPDQITQQTEPKSLDILKKPFTAEVQGTMA